MGNIVTIHFRQDTLFAVERDDGVFVAVKPICDSLGVAWVPQLRKLKDDPVLSKGVTTMVIPSVGGAQESTCLKLEKVNFWLAKMDSRRIKDENAREKLIAYQEECADVLFGHFQGKRKQPQIALDEEPSESENVKLRMVTEGRQIFGTQASAQLWFHLGLPIVPAMRQDPRQLTIFDYSSIRNVENIA